MSCHTRDLFRKPGSGEQLFTNQGYKATSVADIQNAAGISRGEMHHHFASKEDVFAIVFVQTSNEAIRHAATRLIPTIPRRWRLG